MRRSRALLSALALSQVAYPYVPARRRASATRTVVGLMLATSASEAIEARGDVRGVALLSAAGATGFAAELAGVATGRPFGAYHYSEKLGPRIGGVPVLAGAAWAMMARPAWVVAGLLDRRPGWRVPLAAGALTAWDLFLDPRMVREGYWHWAGGGSYEGVPASNFAGWLLVATAAFSLWPAIDPDDEPAADGDTALALYLWTWLGELFANAVIWRRPRVAAVGGLAMGAFAVPALGRRLRPARG